MSCCDRAGLNQVSALGVPAQSGQFGGLLDVSSFAATKGAQLTVELTGTYDGSYSIYGSHDGVVFAPIFSFSSGAGKQNLRQAINFPLKYLVAKKLGSSSSSITLNVSGRAACNCANSGSAGANQFLSLGTFGANAQTGPLASVDLWSLVANTGLDPGMSVTCGGGSFEGLIGIEGSLDGVHFVPLGTDLAGRPTAGFQVAIGRRVPGTTPNAADLAPILIPDVVRYIRPNLRMGTVYTPVSLTVGGRQNCDCPSQVSCNSGAIAFGPTTFAGTDQATNPPSPNIQTVRSFAVDGTTVCSQTAPGGKLTFQFVGPAGEINYQDIGGVTVIVGLDPNNPLEGQAVWDSSINPTAGTWQSLFGREDFTANFNNPNPAGTFYIKITCTPGSGAFAGIRNYTIQIAVV